HLDQLDQRLAAEQQQLDQILKRLEAENADVEKLEKMSVKSIFHNILGNKEKQLEKERQEYLQAALKYDELRKSIELIEYERKVLTEKHNKSIGLEQEINQLIELRKKEILRTNPRLGKELLQITFNIEHHQKMQKEMEEAINVGGKASQVMAQMVNELKKAKNWGRWDMMDGKRMSSYMKHSSLDRARQLSYQVKRLLQAFEDELNDIYQYERSKFDFSLNFQSFSRFTDIFFDNLISDWVVQQKISNALASVRSTNDKLVRTLSYLKADLPKQAKAVEELEATKMELLLGK
ncbi:MAG: hypothetical protein AAFO94_21945, partial [Bacteroidota bacterium]